MKSLDLLIKDIAVIENHNFKENILINKIEVDSRKISAGDIFVCIVGHTVDGHDYALKAVNNGATVLITERYIQTSATQIIVKSTEEAVAILASNYYQNPSDKLKIIGITGTNGKSSTTFIVRHMLKTLGKKCGLIGSVEIDTGNEQRVAKLTTPQPLELQSYFNEMVKNGCEYCVMEVSSHAIKQNRVLGVKFKAAGFTNLTQDHLNYHKTMENYAETKAKLFERATEISVINADDSYAGLMEQHACSKTLFYSINGKRKDGLLISDIKLSGKGTQFVLHYNEDEYKVFLHLVGKFNVYNFLLSFGLVNYFVNSPQDVIDTMDSFKSIPGRFMSVEKNGITAIIDFAHTPDALNNVLKTCKTIGKGKLTVVFGCGGDRDKTKRPIMGEIASQLADNVIVTSDNPRSEDPNAIIDDILEGVRKHQTEFMVEVDRKKAIEYAINNAQNGDIILVAGKGHETYQLIGDKVLPFDDKLVIEEKLREV